MNTADEKLQHGTDWDGENLKGYLATEKFNGCRLFWDGKEAFTKSGNKVGLPENWIKIMPAFPIDCELYAGIGGLTKCSVAIRYSKINDKMKLIIFDAPLIKKSYVERIKFLQDNIKENKILKVIKYKMIKNHNDAFKYLYAVSNKGGEGLMLYNPKKLYTPGRNKNVIKLKPYMIKKDAA